MDSLLTLQHCRLPVVPFSISPASFSSRLHIAAVKASSKSSLSVRSSFASPTSSSSDSFRQNPQILVPISSSILKTTSVTFAAVAALLLMRVSGKPAIAARSPTLTVESEEESTVSEGVDEELERLLADDPNDVQLLQWHLALRFSDSNYPDALTDANRLVELEPNKSKWLLWRGFVRNRLGDTESARNDFEKVLERDPCRFRAYQGIAYSFFNENNREADKIEAIQKRVERVLENYNEQIRKSDLRRFKMLISNTKFEKGSHREAINDLKELEREDPTDFCQHFLLGELYEKLGMDDQAMMQMSICAEIASKNPSKGNAYHIRGIEDIKSDGEEGTN